MEHSRAFRMVQRWYKNGRPIEWVKNAVEKGAVTETEFKEITGEDYGDGNRKAE